MLSNSNGELNTFGTDVLVVDDEPMVRDFVARVLTRNGYECRTVSDAGEAVASATERPPTVVVTDIRMPGKDGSWLLGELHKRWPEMPVIMLTAVSEAKQAVECLKAGAHDYLVKPIDIDELLISVRRGAERIQLSQQAHRNRKELEDGVRNRTARLRGAIQTIEAAYQDTLGALVNSQAPTEPGSANPFPVAWSAVPRLEAGLGQSFPSGTSSEMLGGEEAVELASLRVAGELIARGSSHVEVAKALAQELVGRGKALYARLWIRGGNEPGLEAVIDVGSKGASALPGASLASQALSSAKTHWDENDGVTSVAAPIVVRGVSECVLQLGWPGSRHEDMGALTERLALILAASLSRENDARHRVRTAEELDVFQRLASASRYSLDLQHVAEFLMKSLHRIVDYDVAALLLLEEDPSLAVQARCQMDADFSQRVRAHIYNTLKLTCGVEAPSDLAMTFIDSERNENRREAPHKLRSFVNVPLSVGGAVVGMIHVSSGRDHAFGEEEALFVHRAAEFLASSVQGVRELLAAVKGRVEQMVDHMTDGVLMLDARGRVVAMNGAARQVLGWHGEGAALDAAALAKLLDWNPMSLMEAERRSLRRLVCLRGVAYQTQLSPVVDDAGELVGTVLAFRDFEEEKKADDMKTELVNVVSHELRTPLTAIKNAIHLLGGPKLGALTPPQARFVDLAGRNVEQLIGIINDLLDLSKIEAGKMHFDLEPLSLANPVRDAVLAMEPQAEEKGVVIETAFDSDLPAVHAHAASIQRVVVNLVGNAVKFTERGGRVTVEVARGEGAGLDAEEAVRVTVSDSGIGIPSDQLESIFEKFQQVESQQQRTAPGTGLGLSICRELVKAHHGRIWAESEAGRGSRFSFLIPVLSQNGLLERSVSAEIARAREMECSMMLVVARLANGTSLRIDRGDEAYERAMDGLISVTRKAIRRSSDRVLWRREAGEIAVILPRTAKDGGEAFEKRLLEEIRKDGEDDGLIVSLGAVQYPDDATSAKELYELARERSGETVAA